MKLIKKLSTFEIFMSFIAILFPMISLMLFDVPLYQYILIIITSIALGSVGGYVGILIQLNIFSLLTLVCVQADHHFFVSWIVMGIIVTFVISIRLMQLRFQRLKRRDKNGIF
tara:strand:+ start:505 stop:843 length:339 start_codon:yes stop_codon:yes gene_type:complete